MGVDWERMDNTGGGGAYASTLRARVRGGWLVAAGNDTAPALAFIPDPHHLWDGTPAGNETSAAQDHESTRLAAEVILADSAPSFIREHAEGGESSGGG